MALLCPFWVNKVDFLSINSSSALTLTDLLHCDIHNKTEVWSYVLLANYLIDTDWLCSTAPSLLHVTKKLFIISGEKDYVQKFASSSFSNYMCKEKVKIIEPVLPIAFGVHHTKLVLCVNERGVRIAICTANFIPNDWTQKTQGIYVQDFPKFGMGFVSNQTVAERLVSEFDYVNDFKNEFLRYLGHYGVLSFSDTQTGIPIKLFDEIDFSSANVDLVASVPGYHQDLKRNCFGLGRLQKLLQSKKIKVNHLEKNPVLTWQFSSQGKLTESFLKALEKTMLADTHVSDDGENLCPVVQVVYPTESEVRQSFEGWCGGLSFPVRLASCHPYINSRLHRWGRRLEGAAAATCSRNRALPHLKTYMRLTANRDGLKWFMLTSANLSRAAWGEWQKKEKQLTIRSYELGVLYSRKSYLRFSKNGLYSITPSKPIPPPSTLAGDGLLEVHIDSETGENIQEGPTLFLPYDPLFPEPYLSTIQLQQQDIKNIECGLNTEDIPWVIDVPHFGKDVFGREMRETMESFCGFVFGNVNTKKTRKNNLEITVKKRERIE